MTRTENAALERLKGPISEVIDALQDRGADLDAVNAALQDFMPVFNFLYRLDHEVSRMEREARTKAQISETRAHRKTSTQD